MLIVVFASGFFIMNSVFVQGTVYSLYSGEEIDSISLINGYGTFFFYKESDGENWIVETAGSRYRANADKMVLLLEALGNMPVKRILESERDDYGLGQPVAFVEFKTSSGKLYEYSFGKIGADVSTVYVKSKSGNVILTDSSASDQVNGSLAAYRDKKVFSVDLYNIVNLEYFRGGHLVVSCHSESPIEWYMDFPWKVPARHIELTELIARMAGWVIAGYPEEVDQKKAGLDPPIETLILGDRDGNTQMLEFGRIEGLSRYARAGEQGDPVFLYAADVDFSILYPESLLFIAPLRSRLDQVSSFSVRYGADTWTLSYDQAADIAFWEYGMLSSEEFVGVFFKFISMVADGRDSAVSPQSGENPIAILTIENTNGVSARLELFPRDENSHFMRINGVNTPYFISAERLSNLLGRISELAARKSNAMSL